jgi:hypothetical protein
MSRSNFNVMLVADSARSNDLPAAIDVHSMLAFIKLTVGLREA